jgi:predicted DNA-binding protein
MSVFVRSLSVAIEHSQNNMSKTVTLRLSEDVYSRFKSLAEDDNRPLSNFIETAALRFVEENLYVDEFEMADIRGDKKLNASLQRGVAGVRKTEAVIK